MKAKELFSIRKPALSPGEMEAVAREKVIREHIESCKNRLESIEQVLESSEEDALVLGRRLHADLVSAFADMDSDYGRSRKRSRRPALSAVADTSTRHLLDSAGKRLEPHASDERYAGRIQQAVGELRAGVRGLVRAFRRYKKERLTTPLDVYRRRVWCQVGLVGVVLAAVVAVASAVQSVSHDAAVSRFGLYFEEGRAATQFGDHTEAVKLYRLAIEALPRDPRAASAYNNLGWGLAQLGRYEEAMAAYEAALGLRPSFTLARNNLKWARRRLETVSE